MWFVTWVGMGCLVSVGIQLFVMLGAFLGEIAGQVGQKLDKDTMELVQKGCFIFGLVVFLIASIMRAVWIGVV